MCCQACAQFAILLKFSFVLARHVNEAYGIAYLCHLIYPAQVLNIHEHDTNVISTKILIEASMTDASAWIQKLKNTNQPCNMMIATVLEPLDIGRQESVVRGLLCAAGAGLA